MFNTNFQVMLFADDVMAERDFWQAIGWTISREEEAAGYPYIDLKPNEDTNMFFTIVSKEFMQTHTPHPEVADWQPSILFQTTDIEGLQALVAKHAPVCNPISEVPFRHFNFASPSGHYYAVQAI